jgi:hypothetical protein
VECRIASLQSEAVDFAPIGSQSELGELEQGELAEPYRRTVLEFDLGKAVLSGRKLKAFLDRGVHGGFGPIGDLGPL